MINIRSLQAEVMHRQVKRASVYEEIFKKIISKIKYENTRSDSCTCMYILPGWVFGMPLYDLGGCASYVIRRLQEYGFQVYYKYPNALYISWLQMPGPAYNDPHAISAPPTLNTVTLQDIQPLPPSKIKNNLFDELDKAFIDSAGGIIKAPPQNTRPITGLNIDHIRGASAGLDDVLSALDNNSNGKSNNNNRKFPF